MRIVLTDALHARPANLLVRLVAQHAARIHIRAGDREADASKILDVLALGAHKGDAIEVTASGDEAEGVLAAIAELVASSFDADLVPELGDAVVEGVAIGKAWVLAPQPAPAPRTRGSDAEELGRVRAAIAHAVADVETLLFALPEEEARLFEPELAILRDVEAFAWTRIAGGASAEEAVLALDPEGVPDLVLDARTRLLDALSRDDAFAAAGDEHDDAADVVAHGTEHVLVAETLTPSTVAMLPASVTGIVIAMDDERAATEPGTGHGGTVGAGYTSHAAILARSRGIPLVFMPADMVATVGDGDLVVLDTTITPARLWVDPSEALVEHARTRREALLRAAEDEDEAARGPLDLGVAVRVNLGSATEAVPPAAEGVGLLRTELVFAGRALPPSEAEQLATYLAVAARARGGLVNVRLFDAGGDKPIAWMPPPADDADARGIALLLRHEEILGAQLRAAARAAKEHPCVRVLLPLVRTPADVEAVRRRAGAGVAIGAMVETLEGASAVDAIAAAADFVCIGTNDLAASVLGVDRAILAARRRPESGEAPGAVGDAFAPRVLEEIARIVDGAHARGRTVTVCGEMAADVVGARILVGLGVDALSVTPNRVPGLKRALAGDSREACRAAAEAAIRGSSANRVTLSGV